ncbi:MAG: tetratricopeptide repeat protein, partial [Myxococcales bacterium]|nr:tetratricopeptide repeat protein [Myxococcales bacterium]
ADEAQALRLRAAVAEAQPSVRVFTDGEVPGWPTLDPRVASWAELEAVPLKVAAAVECEWAALFHSTGGDDLRALAGDAPLPQVRDALARHDAPAQLRLLEGPALAALQAQDVGQLALVAAWADRCVAVPRFESSAHRLAAATLPALIRLDDRASLTSIAHVMGWLDLAARWRPADLEGELRRLNHAGAVQVAALLANEEPGSQAGVEEVLQAAFALAESGATEEADRRLAALLDRPGLSPPNRAAALRSLAHQRLQAGKPQEAVDFAREALTIQRETLGQAHPEVGSTAHYLGRALREAGQAAEAEPVLREALRVKAEGAGDASATYAATLHELGSTLGALGYLQEAEVALCDALATKRSTLPAHHPEIARTLHELGVVVLRSGRPDEAASLFSDAIALQPKGSVGWAVSAAMRAQLVARDDPAKGVAQLHEALNTHVERRGAAHPVSRAMADNLASLLGETPPRP